MLLTTLKIYTKSDRMFQLMISWWIIVLACFEFRIVLQNFNSHFQRSGEILGFFLIKRVNTLYFSSEKSVLAQICIKPIKIYAIHWLKHDVHIYKISS